MRFTQESFDKMDKSGMEIHAISSFEEYPYLVNNVNGIGLLVSNSLNSVKAYGRTAIETCDPKLFRQYCGLENPVEDELKDAISKNKRGVGIIAIRLMQVSLDEELSDFEKAITGQAKENPLIDSPIENQEIFQSKELEYFNEAYQEWKDFWLCNQDIKLRFKPNPTKTLDTEIEALNQKAKEMGFKAVITFESL